MLILTPAKMTGLISCYRRGAILPLYEDHLYEFKVIFKHLHNCIEKRVTRSPTGALVYWLGREIRTPVFKTCGMINLCRKLCCGYYTKVDKPHQTQCWALITSVAVISYLIKTMQLESYVQ